MGKPNDIITDKQADFIRRQHLFFVATAPLSDSGQINLSPKGLDSFRLIDQQSVAYLDLVGSGIETVAHLKENGRIVIMFCAFDGPPNILRLHGRGEVIQPHHPDFPSLLDLFPPQPGVRSIIRVNCHRASDSCGYGVPLYEFQGDRTQLPAYAQRKGEAGLRQFQQEENIRSIDGLPGIELH